MWGRTVSLVGRKKFSHFIFLQLVPERQKSTVSSRDGGERCGRRCAQDVGAEERRQMAPAKSAISKPPTLVIF